jgi:DNA-binding winged helix-turn-helix (wHTH) protein/TolB-like protein
MTGRVQFGPFVFDPSSGQLWRAGIPVRLPPQPARVLAALVGRAGTVISRDELRQLIWADGTIVDFERGLNFCIAQLRSALGDSADAPRYIETAPKRGYRFVAPVTGLEPTPGAAGAAADGFATVPRRVVLASLGALAAAAAGAAIWARTPPRPVYVAVLSFDNETGQDAFDRVAVAIADQTVARLATPDRVQRLAVIGNAAPLRRPRAFRDIKALGVEVGADYVVLAQMKVDAARVRLIAHLIRVTDQAHLWAHTFDRPEFTLDAQSEVAEAIAAAVTAQLAGR